MYINRKFQNCYSNEDEYETLPKEIDLITGVPSLKFVYITRNSKDTGDKQIKTKKEKYTKVVPGTIYGLEDIINFD